MCKVISFASASVAIAVAGYVVWRRNPRVGSGFVNRVIDPILLDSGLSGTGRSEIGTLEHIGRRSGTRRLTPVHPVPTDQGFRIIVPLGRASEWARNVLAAGYCRLELHDTVHELDEPVLVEPAMVLGLSTIARVVSSWLGFRYLLLKRLSSAPGWLAESATEPIPQPEAVSRSEGAPSTLVALPG